MGRSADRDGSSQYLVEHVRDALASHPTLGELELQVAVAGDAIEVSGIVQTSERRDAITKVLTDLFPDYQVRNRTTVLSPTDHPRVEKLS